MDTTKLFHSLVAMVAIDGEISGQELQFLHGIRQRLNIPRNVITSALHEAKQGKRRVHLPKNEVEQTALLELLVQAAYADGTISPEEHNILRAVAEKIGVLPTELKMKIHDVYKSMPHSETASKNERSSDAPVQEKRQCPKCGYLTSDPNDPLFTGDEGHGECPACGIILRRYRANGNRRTRASREKERSGTPGPLIKCIGIAVVTFPFLIVLADIAMLWFPDLRLWIDTRNSIQVQATLYDVNMEVSLSSGKTREYTLDANYTFIYNGKPYGGYQVAISDSLDYFTASRLYKRLKKAIANKEQVPCYVNRHDPSIAVLDKRLYGISNYMLAIFGAGWALFYIVRYILKIVMYKEEY